MASLERSPKKRASRVDHTSNGPAATRPGPGIEWKMVLLSRLLALAEVLAEFH